LSCTPINIPLLCAVVIQFGEFGTDALGHRVNVDHIDATDALGHKFTAVFTATDELGHKFTVAVQATDALGHKFNASPISATDALGHRFNVDHIDDQDELGHKFNATPADQLGHKFTIPGIDVPPYPFDEGQRFGHRFNVNEINASDSLGHKFRAEIQNHIGHRFNCNEIRDTDELGHKFTVGFVDQADALGHKFTGTVQAKDNFSHKFNIDHIDATDALGHKFALPFVTDNFGHKFSVSISTQDEMEHRFGVFGDPFGHKFAVAQNATDALGCRFGVTQDDTDELGHEFNIAGINANEPLGHRLAVEVGTIDALGHHFSAIGQVLNHRFAVEQDAEDQFGHKFQGALRAFDFLFHRLAITQVSTIESLGHKFFQPFNIGSDALGHIFSANGVGSRRDSLQHKFEVNIPKLPGFQGHRFQVMPTGIIDLDGDNFNVVAIRFGYSDIDLDAKTHVGSDVHNTDILDSGVPHNIHHDPNSMIRHTSDLPVPLDDGIGIDRFIRGIFEHSILGNKPPETGTLGVGGVPAVAYEINKNQTFGTTVFDGGDGFKRHPIENDVYPFTFNDVDGSAAFDVDVWRLTKPLLPILAHPDPRVANTNDPFPGLLVEHGQGTPDDHTPFDHRPIGSEEYPSPLEFDIDLGGRPYLGLIKIPVFVPATPTSTKASGEGLDLNTPDHTFTRTGLFGALPSALVRGQGIFPIPFDNYDVNLYRFNEDPQCNLTDITISNPDGSDTILNDTQIKVQATGFNIFEDSDLPGQAISQVWPIDKLTITLKINNIVIGQNIINGPIFPPFDPAMLESTFNLGGPLLGGELAEAIVEIQLRPGAGRDGKLSNGSPLFYAPGAFDPDGLESVALVVAPYFATPRICRISDTITVKFILRLPALLQLQLEAPNKVGEILLLKEVSGNAISGTIIQVRGDKLLDLLGADLGGTVIRANKNTIEQKVSDANLTADQNLSRNSRVTVRYTGPNAIAKIALVDDDI